jgi:hypothetical protein
MLTRLLTVVIALSSLLVLGLAGPASAEAPQVRTPPSITGNAVVGGQLTAHNGTWLYDNGLSCRSECQMTYQWERCSADGGSCGAISNATGRFYTVQAADAGSRLRVMETMSIHDCGAGDSQTGIVECRWDRRSAASPQTGVVPGAAPTPPATPTPPAAPTPPSGPPAVAPLAPSPAAAPEITGVAMVDEVLTATKGRWSATGALALNLEWLRCDADGENCVGLGITGETYTAGVVDVGKTLRVRVTAANPYGARVALSAPTAVVSELKPTSAKPSIEAAKVTAPHKLTLQVTRVTPQRLSRRTPIELDVIVRDTRGFLVSGAVVSAVALPAAGFARVEATESAADGAAGLTIKPTVKLRLRKRGVVTLVITARRATDRVVSPRSSSVKLTIPIRPASR